MQSTRQISLDLDEIAALLEFSGASRFKVKAYARAAEVVNTLGEELGPLVEQGRLQELEGIGPALSRQIDEMWNAGTSELLTTLRSEQPPGVGELVRVEGLTPRRIRALYDALGTSSVEGVRDACRAERVRTVRGFGAKTEASLLAACERFLTRDTTNPDPVLLSAGLELAGLLRKRLLGVVDDAIPVGALRRGEEMVREIEFVVVGDVDRALNHLSSLRQVLRIDAAERLAYLSDGLLLRLHAAEPSRLGTALIHATGNAGHLAGLLVRAKERDLAPAAVDSAVLGTGDFLTREFAAEAELYASLELSFVPPELRAGRGEVAEAAHSDFADLLELSDIQGMVHCHTTYSDGKHSVTEMALAAHALGMKYITITDHSPSAHYARGVSLDRLKAQWDDIAAAQEQVPIRILRGTESDILSDGSLDFPDSILESFDVVIASIHARHRMDRATMTERLTRALALPIFKIWGHALGRILNHRDPFDCDVLHVLDTLANARGAVEINADPHRLDLAPAWIPAARERGIPLVVSVDAHSMKGLGVLGYGVTMARRGGVRRGEVLNALPADEFAARVRPAAGEIA